MAIAFDTAVSSQANAVTTNTFSHTITGSNPLLVVGVQFAAGTDISGVPTYNGTNMTFGGSYSLGGPTFDKTYVYYLAGPPTGAHNIVINNTGGANYIYAASASYTGVSQVSTIDVSGAAVPTTGTSLSKSVTTTVNNDWLVGYFSGGSTGAALTASGVTLFRTSPGGGSWNNIGDSNGSKSPAGSYSLAMNAGASDVLGIFVLAIKPTGSVTGNSSFLTFM